MIDKKVILVFVCALLAVGGYVSASVSQQKSRQAFEDYSRLQSDIERISQIKEIYKTKEQNRAGIDRMLRDYADNLARRDETDSAVEFTLEDLGPDRLDSFVKGLVNNNFQITQFRIERQDAQNAKLHCKVSF